MSSISLISLQGNHPEDGQPVIIKLAKVGFSIRHRRTIASVPKVCFYPFSVSLITIDDGHTHFNKDSSNQALM